jgi:hypothetical protein
MPRTLAALVVQYVHFPNVSVPLSFNEIITTLLAKGDRQMWIAKGVLLGFGLFVGGLFLLVVLSVLSAIVKGSIQYNHATSVGVIYGMTFGNPFFYLALLGCLLVGVSLVGSWPIPVR